MTINLSMNFQRRPWASPLTLGGLAKGLPAGHWSASALSEGDASGGNITFQHIFRNASNRLGDSNFYSIEQMAIFHDNNGVTSMRLQVNGMDAFTGDVSTIGNPVNREYAIDLDTTDESTPRRAMSRPNGYKIWIGTYQGAPTDLGDMIFLSDNPGASAGAGAVVYGYYWTPDAQNAPGGMRKPPGDIYAV